MDYAKLVAVSGLPGLFELINSKTDGAIVRSLEDNTTKFASSRIHNFSHLESIEVYTVNDNVNLVEIFHAMEKHGGDLPDGKDNAAIKKYFEKAYPDMDFERVYGSDLKKMLKWFEVLKKNKVEIKLSEPIEEEEEETQPEIEEVKKEPKAAAKKEVKEKESKASEPKEKETKGKAAIIAKDKKPAVKKDKADDKPKKEAPKKTK